MNFEDTQFEGLKIVHHFRAQDARGVFIKPWLSGELTEVFGSVAEAYFSSSEQGVLRGLHFQRGIHAQKKYVVCLYGAIEDVALDMRPDSRTYGELFRMRIDAMSGVGVIIPAGFAHGIFAHVPSTIANFCDKPYAPGDEGGVHWSSIGALSDLQVTELSAKDGALPVWSEIQA